VVLLERARIEEPDTVLERASAIRARLSGRPVGDVVTDVREERAR
jgi:hypothetical protein